MFEPDVAYTITRGYILKLDQKIIFKKELESALGVVWIITKIMTHKPLFTTVNYIGFTY